MADFSRERQKAHLIIKSYVCVIKNAHQRTSVRNTKFPVRKHYKLKLLTNKIGPKTSANQIRETKASKMAYE